METKILNFIKNNKTGVLLLTAPTGSGKTTGICRLVQAHSQLFGTTWIIQPTKIANKSIGGIAMTPIQVLEKVLRTKQFFCDTLIIDEVHTRSVEYETLLHLASLKQDFLRILLLTATPCMDRLKTYFPKLVPFEMNQLLHFPIQIEYNNCFEYGFPSLFNITQEVEKMLNENRDHKKILVFLYTHEQCERLASYFADKNPLFKTRALYGGMDQEEWNSFSDFIRTNDRFYIFSTNVVETSITIPDLSLIIDLGIQCINEKNRIIYTHCSKSSLIQRAGRTGRTCPGKVIRTMSESDFHFRPFERDPEFSWDIIFLRILSNRCPKEYFPPSLDYDNCMKRATHLGFLDSQQINFPIIKFCIESPMLIQHSAMLFNLIQKKVSVRDIYVFTLVLGFIDAYITRKLKVLFYNSTMNIIRQKSFWSELFRCGNYDELHLVLNAFASCVLSANPKEYAKRCFLNFKSIKIISNHIYSLFHFVSQKIQHPLVQWKLVLTSECSVKMRHNYFLQNSTRPKIEQIHLFNAMEDIQKFLFYENGIIVFLAQNDFLYNPKLFLNYHSCCVEPIDNANIPLILFGQDVVMNSSEEQFLHVNLYTQCPKSIRRFSGTLASSLISSVIKFNDLRLSRKEHKLQMSPIFSYILQNIAFRPNNWGIEKQMGVLLERIRSFLN